MDLNPQQSFKSVSVMSDRMVTHAQLEAQVANLRAECDALQSELAEVRAREVMLVSFIDSLEGLFDYTGSREKARRAALSASSTEVAKWAAERDAKVLEGAAIKFRTTNCTLLPSTIECAEALEQWANELRASASQPTIKE